MKYKALMLSLLLLLPLGILALPTHAHEFVQPALSVFPTNTKFYGPCIKSMTFPIDIYLWNNPLSNEDVYAFDFNLTWTAPDISLVSATYHSPWTNFFEIANQTADHYYHLALTAVPPSTGLFDVNMSVLTLVFHIDSDVCWPGVITGVFTLNNVSMAADGNKAIPITSIEIDNGTYEQYSVQPNIELSTTDAAFNATTNTITEKCNSHTFDVEVDLTNVTNVYGFSFGLTYNPYELETDVQKITFKSAFPPPYETLGVTVTPGLVSVNLIRPSEKPGVCGALVPAVDIIFHTNDTKDGKGIIPTPSTSSITITNPLIYAKCPGPVTYYPNAIRTTWTIVNSTWTTTNGGSGFINIATATDDGANLYLTVGDTVDKAGYPLAGAAVTIAFPGYPGVQYFELNWPGSPYAYSYWNGSAWFDATTLTGVGNFTVAINPATNMATFAIPFANLAGYIGGQTLGIGFYWYTATGITYQNYETGDSYTQQPLLFVGPALIYKFKPSQYDLNLDCVVDVQDLKVLLPYYGMTTGAGGYGYIFGTTGLVDIYDFVAVAKHFGTVDP